MKPQRVSLLRVGLVFWRNGLAALGALFCVVFSASALGWAADRGFLTAQESAWIDAHPGQLRIAPEANYPPFSFVASGQWQGLSADIVGLLQSRIGASFEIVPAQNLDTLLDDVRQGHAEIVTSIKETEERSEFLLFTQPYLSVPTAIIVKNGFSGAHWPRDFVGKRVAVGKGYGVQKFLESTFPEVQLTLVPDDLEGLRKLSFGEIDAAIMDIASASFMIEQEKITNLRIFETFSYTYDLSFGIRKDLPVLREVMSKALTTLSEQDRRALMDKWISLRQDPLSLLWVGIRRWLPVLVVVFATLLLIAAMTWRFQRQRRSIELKAAQYTRSLIEASLDPLVTISVEGKITDVNRATELVTGRSRDGLIGSDFANYFTEPDQARDVYRQVFRRSITDYPLALRHVSGKVTDVLYNASVYRDAQGKALGVFAAARDVTERVRAEKSLAYSQRLEERTVELEEARRAAEAANVAKSVFLANMSHEIRTPLNAITGMAHLIRQSGLAPQQAERLDKMVAAGAHLLGIINAILDLSKIDANKFELEEAPVRIEGILDNVASMVQQRAQAKQLALSIDAEGIPSQLLGDPTRLKQALLNYATNAVKFTERGGIVLRARMMEETPANVLIRFEVQDTGIGIDPVIQPRLFSAFEQADNTMTRKYGGTGLGLAITKRIALLMGGDAGVNSTLGGGSTFWFSVRLRKGSLPMEETGFSGDAEAVLLKDFPACRILLVEDDPVNCEVGVMLLNKAGQVVDVASDGVQALDCVARNTYDVILMDMQMPKMDGLEATQEIRKLANGARVPVLAMTANAFTEDRARCFEAGMNDFITKPVEPKLLFETLVHWLSKTPENRHGKESKS